MATKNTKKHGIGWLNVPGYIPQTWNPIVGCSKVSEGCRNCYAERMANRLKGMGTRGYTDVTDASGRWNGIIEIVGTEIQKPLGWSKPRAIFVNSMGDLFHENTPDGWIDDCRMKTKPRCKECGELMSLVETPDGLRFVCWVEACGVGVVTRIETDKTDDGDGV